MPIVLPSCTCRRAWAAPDQRSCVIWLSGLSGSGKSTVGAQLAASLQALHLRATMLDGDQLRQGLCKDLRYSEADRHENLRRAGEVCKLFADVGMIVIAAFISPTQADRDMVRALVRTTFLEIHCNAPLEVCEARDVKGLYARARRGEIPDFTGVSAPYEIPTAPELILDTVFQSVEQSAAQIMRLLAARQIIHVDAAEEMSALLCAD